MEKLREHLTDDSRQAKPSAAGGVKRLSTDAAATTAELRDFVRGLKGRSPQEVMGIVTNSALTQAIIGSAIATVVLIAVLSVPFASGSSTKSKSAKPKGASAATESEPSKTKEKSVGGSDQPSEEDIKKASKAMGLDETKTADPKKNPLDSFDNLLDKVK